jgi:putative MATE family efflux protein
MEYGMKTKARGMDMTNGNIWKLIVTFAIPLLLGNLLQQLYNAFDAIVAGNFVSKEALSAVGMSLPMINLLLGFFMGMSTGASVVVAQFFGAKNRESLKRTIETALLLALFLGSILSLIGVTATPQLLHLMNTPEEIFPHASIYFRIFFAGLSALTVYNMGAAILNALGDSKKPLQFLIISAILNIVLDLLFVLQFNMGIAGVAWATVIAEVISAILVVHTLCQQNMYCPLVLKEVRIHTHELRRIIALGLPVGSQQVIVGMSNVGLQMYINGLGTLAVAGWSIAAKMDAFVWPLAQAIALAATTFVGQNLGAKKVHRARQGVQISILLGLSITAFASVFILYFHTPLLKIFSPDQEVIDAAYKFMQLLTTTYFLYSLTQILPGIMAGSGDVRTPNIISIVSYVIVRQIYLFIVSRVHYTMLSVAFAYPLSWILAGTALLIYYRKSNWDHFSPNEYEETDELNSTYIGIRTDPKAEEV